jgi:hypothetical protein
VGENDRIISVGKGGEVGQERNKGKMGGKEERERDCMKEGWERARKE